MLATTQLRPPLAPSTRVLYGPQCCCGGLYLSVESGGPGLACRSLIEACCLLNGAALQPTEHHLN